MKTYPHLLFVFAILSFVACEKADKDYPEKVDDSNYAPLKVGNFIIYQVDSIVYDDFTLPVTVDTFHYKVKEQVDESFVDGENREAFQLGRYVQQDSSSVWQLERRFTLTKTDNKLVRFDENIPVIHLNFPVKEGKVWDGNALNTSPEQLFEYKNLHRALAINSHYFDTTIQVVQLNEENLIERQYVEEIYAKGVGLVKKKSTFLKTELNGNIRSGSMVVYEVVKYQ